MLVKDLKELLKTPEGVSEIDFDNTEVLTLANSEEAVFLMTPPLKRSLDIQLLQSHVMKMVTSFLMKISKLISL